MRILFGLAVCVSTMKGSKQICPAPGLGQFTVAAPPMVLDALFVPHQLLVAVTCAPGLVVKRLLPPAVALLPASRLKLITKKLPLALLSTFTPPPPPGLPPPAPVALWPVMVTLLSVVV
jgi:hypothetical protein